MNLLEFFKSGSGLLLVLLTLVQIAPIKVNPWSAIFKAIGKSINELLREIPHTREDFIEILSEVDFYEKYCGSHPQYKNNRAVHAVENIKKCYAERLQKHDFL